MGGFCWAVVKNESKYNSHYLAARWVKTLDLRSLRIKLAFFPLIKLYIMWAIIVYLLYCDYLFNTLNYAVLFPSMLFCSLVFCISVSFRLLFTLISVVNLAFAACTLFPCLPHLSNIIFLLLQISLSTNSFYHFDIL